MATKAGPDRAQTSGTHVATPGTEGTLREDNMEGKESTEVEQGTECADGPDN